VALELPFRGLSRLPAGGVRTQTMKVRLVKKLSALYAYDEAGEAALRRLAPGEIVEVGLTRPRNAKFHRLFWALMTLVWNNIENVAYPTVEDLVTEVKIITGHYTRRDMVVDGKHYPVLTPKSISFAAMDDVEFDAFFQRVCDWIAKDVLPGITQEDLKQELETMTGMREPTAV